MVKLVRALFEYKAQDTGNLSFSAGEIIQVFTVLESGWWDGISNNKRGWFPSNYVTPIVIRSQYEEAAWVQKATSDNKQYWYNEVTGESTWNKSSADLIVLPPNWVIQETPDGRNSFFYNQVTSEVHWTLPQELVHLILPSSLSLPSTNSNTHCTSLLPPPPSASAISTSLHHEPISLKDHSNPASSTSSSAPNNLPSSASTLPSTSSSNSLSPTVSAIHPFSSTAFSPSSSPIMPLIDRSPSTITTSPTPTLGPSSSPLPHDPSFGTPVSSSFPSTHTTPTPPIKSFNTDRVSFLSTHSTEGTSLREDPNLPLSTASPNPLLPLPPLPPPPPALLVHSNPLSAACTPAPEILVKEGQPSDFQAVMHPSTSSLDSSLNSFNANQDKSNSLFFESNSSSTHSNSDTFPQQAVSASILMTSQVSPLEPPSFPPSFQKEKQDSAIEDTLNLPPLPPSPSLPPPPAPPLPSTATSAPSSSFHEDILNTELTGSKETPSYPFPSLSLLLPSNPTMKLSPIEEQMQAWALLTQQIFSAIHKLHKCAKSNMKNQYIMSSSRIVDAIRSMLVASKTADKESPVIKSNPPLKLHHRALLGALSKLVLSAKLASGIWPPPDAVQKMIMDASELLTSVKKFVEIARDSGIEISTDIIEQHRRAFAVLEAASPTIPKDPCMPLSPGALSNRRPSSPMINHPSTPTPSSASSSIYSSSSLSVCSATSFKSAPSSECIFQQLDCITQNVIDTLKKLEEQAHQTISVATLIFLTRNAVTQVGQFLTLIEDIHLEKGPECPLLHEFKVSKQSLYNNIAGLVMATQTVTAASPPNNAMDQVLLSINIVETSVTEVLFSTRELLNAKTYRNSVESSHKHLAESFPPLYGQINEQQQNTEKREETKGEHEKETKKENERKEQAEMENEEGKEEEEENVKTPMSTQARHPQSGFSSPSSSLKNGSNGSTPSTPKSHLVLNTQLANSFSPSAKGLEMSSQFSLAYSESSSSSQFPLTTPLFPISATSPSPSSSISPCKSAPPNCGLASASNASLNTTSISLPGTSYSSTSSPPNTPSSAKLRKFFGDDADTASKEALSLSQQRTKEETPWFLQVDYHPFEIVFNLEGQVKGGTINALVERLTMHSKYDPSFTSAFLLTYRTFMTTHDLFDALVQRFGIKTPEGLSNTELETWIEKKMTPIRLRVFNVMKSWLENYCLPYIPDDHQILESMSQFARCVVRPVMSLLSISMTKLIDKRIASPTPHLPLRGPQPTTPITHVSAQIPFPSSILPRNLQKFKFMDIDPLEIARQLTLIEFSLFSRIIYTEFLNKAWSSDRGVSESEARARAPNLRRMIEMSNRVTCWVADTILGEEDPRRRCLLVKQFITIANHCKVLHNFNTLFAILSALHSAPIHRLSRTWDMVSPKSLCIMNELTSIIDPHKNFSIYRDLLHALAPPCIPFLGRYLSDLTFLEDGQPNVLKPMMKETHLLLINFGKRFKIAEIIREVQQFQIVPFHLKPVPEIQSFLMEMIDRTSGETSSLYEISLHLEPRERDDEKLVRLLEESGLL